METGRCQTIISKPIIKILNFRFMYRKTLCGHPIPSGTHFCERHARAGSCQLSACRNRSEPSNRYCREHQGEPQWEELVELDQAARAPMEFVEAAAALGLPQDALSHHGEISFLFRVRLLQLAINDFGVGNPNSFPNNKQGDLIEEFEYLRLAIQRFRQGNAQIDEGTRSGLDLEERSSLARKLNQSEEVRVEPDLVAKRLRKICRLLPPRWESLRRLKRFMTEVAEEREAMSEHLRAFRQDKADRASWYYSRYPGGKYLYDQYLSGVRRYEIGAFGLKLPASPVWGSVKDPDFNLWRRLQQDLQDPHSIYGQIGVHYLGKEVVRSERSHFNKDASPKVSYGSLEEANAATLEILTSRGEIMSAYACSEGRHYHIGHAKTSS